MDTPSLKDELANDFSSLILKGYKKAKSLPVYCWWKLCSYLLMTFVIVPHLTIFMFVIYMAEHDFFSYDFFIQGIFAMKIFVLTSGVIIVFLSLILYSPLLLIAAHKKGHKPPAFAYILLTLLALAMWGGIGLDLISAKQYGYLVFIAFICFLITALFATYFFSTAKTHFITLLVTSFFVLALATKHSDLTAKIVSIGLKSFKVGGGLPISISYKDSEDYIEGKLILISPNNIYFIPKLEDDSFGGVATAKQSNNLFYIIGDN